MKTFGSFVQEKTLQGKLIEAATLLSIKCEDPDQFIKTWYETNHPELFIVLNEGIWDNVKQAGSQMWQGVKQGAQNFAANQWGPQAKFDQAVKTLNDLVQYMSTNPQLANMKGTTGPLINQIGGIIKQLSQLKDHMPQMNTQTTSTWSQPNAGGAAVSNGPPTNAPPVQGNVLNAPGANSMSGGGNSIGGI